MALLREPGEQGKQDFLAADLENQLEHPKKQSPSLLSIVPAVLAELLQGFDRFWVFQCKFLYFLGHFLCDFWRF